MCVATLMGDREMALYRCWKKHVPTKRAIGRQCFALGQHLCFMDRVWMLFHWGFAIVILHSCFVDTVSANALLAATIISPDGRKIDFNINHKLSYENVWCAGGSSTSSNLIVSRFFVYSPCMVDRGEIYLSTRYCLAWNVMHQWRCYLADILISMCRSFYFLTFEAKCARCFILEFPEPRNSFA